MDDVIQEYWPHGHEIDRSNGAVVITLQNHTHGLRIGLSAPSAGDLRDWFEANKERVAA